MTLKRSLIPVRALFGAAMLLAGTASLAPAHAAGIAAQDLGAAPSGTILTARVSLPSSNETALQAALRARYTYGNPLFHHWMSPSELAALGPRPADLATVEAQLAAAGLRVSGVSRSGLTLTVSGTASAMQRAFGAPIHMLVRDGVRSFAHVGSYRMQGALSGRVSGVSGLAGGLMQPALAHQRNADGSVVAGVPVPAAGSSATLPLGAFTNQCFSPGNVSVSLSSPLPSPGVSATYTGIGYALSGKFCGYTPQQIAAHYGIDQAYQYGIDGRGQTIVIIDAYGSPTAMADANTFFAAVGVVPFTSSNFQIITPAGAPATVDYGWAGETALDIELAHALAPQANIVLAVSPTANDSDLQATLQYVIDNHVGNVVSNSYGESEVDSDPNTIMEWNTLTEQAALQGISVLFSSGDQGDYGVSSGTISVSSPADCAWATAVGGTSLDVPSGGGVAETGWGTNASLLSYGNSPFVTPVQEGMLYGGGGGHSFYIAKPSWQNDLPGAYRLVPDLGLIADPETGAIIVSPTSATTAPVFETIGGTSVASPVFAAMWTLANEAAGWNPATGSITPGSSFGLPGPQLTTFQSYLLTDALPLSAPNQLAISITIPGSTGGTAGSATTTYTGPGALDLPNSSTALTVLNRNTTNNDYGVISFNTDSSLATTTGYDYATGRGVPNGAGAVALAAVLFGQ